MDTNYKHIKIIADYAEIINADRVVTVELTESNKVRIEESCDSYFNVEMSKEDAIATFKEFIHFIENT